MSRAARDRSRPDNSPPGAGFPGSSLGKARLTVGLAMDSRRIGSATAASSG
ncbi:hypothetical protein OH687_23845 [Burkholderia anthina]|nr:hypothetical protein OH687_23845 [Burkholderia anthina]